MEATLSNYLQESVHSYEQLLAFMEKKKEALIKNDSDIVQEIARKEQNLLKEIAVQEATFIEALGNEKVIAVIENMPQGEKKLEAEEMLQKLEVLITTIAEQNDVIKVLLKDALQFSQFTRTQLLQPTQMNYGNPSKKSKNIVQKQGFFDTKA
jgi:hypothetical protein